MNNEYEYIKPWDGEHDTGYDVRKKLENNFKKIAGNFNEITNELQSYLKKNDDGTIEGLFTFLNGIKIGDKQLLDIILTTDTNVEDSDTNVYSAAKSVSKFLKKDEADTAKEEVTFEKGLRLSGKQLLDIIRSVDNSVESDINIYSAAKSLLKFIKKDGDTVSGLLQLPVGGINSLKNVRK